MATIHSVPVDILVQEIFSHLDTKTVWSVTPCVCKAWQHYISSPSAAWRSISIPQLRTKLQWLPPAAEMSAFVLASTKLRAVCQSVQSIQVGANQPRAIPVLLPLLGALRFGALNSLKLDTAVPLQAVRWLTAMPALHTLHLRVAAQPLSNATVDDLELACLARLQNLQELALRFDSFVLVPTSIPRLPKLRHLELRNAEATGEASALAVQNFFPKQMTLLRELRRLDIDLPAGVFPTFVTGMANLHHLRLRYLSLVPMPAVQDQAMLAELMPALLLQLHHPVDVPVGIKGLRRLKSLIMEDAEDGVLGLEYLSELPALAHLELQRCGLSRVPSFHMET